MGIIRFRCSDDLESRFMIAAQKAGLTPAELGRAILERTLPKDALHTNDPAEVESLVKDANNRPTKMLSLRVTPLEHAALSERAKAMGMTTYTWTLRLIRAVLTKSPQVNYAETQALREASRELSFVGRNLNQVAHSLNINANADRPAAELLAEVNAKVDEARKQIKALLDENLHRWGI